MPRYFFDVYDGIAMPDSTGRECLDISAARKQAALRAAELLNEAPSACGVTAIGPCGCATSAD